MSAVTEADLAKLTPEECDAFTAAATQVARDENPDIATTATLILAIQRLITEPVVAEGNGPLLDPDCRDGKCGSCVGAPCQHECHREAGGNP